MEHKSLKVGALPEYWFIIPWLCARGAGILKVIALWNFLLLGSTVTIGETATPRPRSLAVNSGSIGWAWGRFVRELFGSCGMNVNMTWWEVVVIDFLEN